MMDRHVGEALRSETVLALDGPAKVTGTARYTFDLAFPGMLHAKILRSPHAHARIRRIDTARAEALPGVVCVVTGADAARLPDPTYGVFIRDQPVLAIDKVRHVGDSVAAVAAIDEATAFRALALIEVEYEVLPALMDPEDALAVGAPLLFETPSPGIAVPVGAGSTSAKEPRPNVLCEYRYRRGDVDAALAAAAHVFTDTFRFSRINHFLLEPYVNVARIEGGKVELWSCNQDPFIVRNDIARIFGLAPHRVRVHTTFVGGGFGGKSYCKMEPLAVLLAMRARAPVRLCLSMDEGLLTLTKHAAVLRLTTGVAADGTLLARRSAIRLDGGAYADASTVTAVKVAYRISGAYRWQALDSHAEVVRTTTVPAGSFRGFGGTQASYASESQIDMIARRLGIDPYDFRKRNLLALGEAYAPGDSAMDSDLAAGLDEVATRLGYRGRRSGQGRGMGMAIGLKDAGGTGNHGQALVKIIDSGDVIVCAGTVEIGQGTTTALCRVAAETIGVPLARVAYAAIDTDATPLNNGTHVSDGIAVTGLAVARAAADARAQVLAFAAEQLGCPAGELAFDDGAVLQGNYRHPLRALVARHYGNAGFEFIGKGAVKVAFDKEAPLNSRNFFWLPSWAGAEVEVDLETGRIHVHRLVVGGDAGRVINPLACRGQVEGGGVQAYGQALFEELRYAGEDPENAAPLAYRVPLATDLPDVLDSFVAEHAAGPGPFKAKGLGEGGMLAVAAAIANAVEDATGARVAQIPLTPERVLEALARAADERTSPSLGCAPGPQSPP
jgi:CO/xanthine dehydrogenase Mo-binding subunit